MHRDATIGMCYHENFITFRLDSSGPRFMSNQENCTVNRVPWLLIASTDQQCTADPFDKRSNYPHSHPLPCGRNKSLRQTRAVIGDRERIALSGSLQPDRDLAFAVLGRIRDHFVDDEAKRNGGDGRKRDFDPSTTMTRSGRWSEDNIVEKSRQRSSRNCLNATLCTPSQ